MENEIENTDSLNGEETPEEVAETTEETIETEEVDVVKLKELNKKLFERAKKAEGYILKDGEWVLKPKAKPTAKKEQEVQIEDVTEVTLALQEAGIKSEEYQRVKELSTLLKKSILETVKDSTAQQILKSERDERATANATTTSAKARNSGKSSKDAALDNFEKGKVPETEEGQANLAKAQFEQLLNKGK